jgi:hypothetical protein
MSSRKLSLVVPEWMFSVLTETRIREIAQEVITSVRRAGLSKAVAIASALSALEAECDAAGVDPLTPFWA